MKKTLVIKLISVLLVIATLMVSLPLNVFAEEVQTANHEEVYIKSVKLAQAPNKEQAKSLLEGAGYIFLDSNLNAGTGDDGVWMGYTTTTNPNEAIYDIKLMNTDGGYTLTSMESVVDSQKTAFAQMADDLCSLVDEFVQAYEAGSISAQKAYMALNFFRVVDGETELIEENGLGYQLVNGLMTKEQLTNMILFCDGSIFDSVVKLLTMGIQMSTENWMEALQKKGVYTEGTSYGNDEAELKRRAKQLLVVLQLYAETYNAMDKMGLVSGKFDAQGNIVKDSTPPENGGETNPADPLPAQQADLVKVDINRVKSYKLVFDELEQYTYGNQTMKAFFCSLEKEKNEKVLYPLVSVLTDGEFSALSYGCFLEVALGATAKSSDFEDYDEMYAELTKEVKSLYLYSGVNSVLLNKDSVIGYTDTASQHMALTGEYQFYEKQSYGEYAWETGKMVALSIGASGMMILSASKLTLGIMSLTGVLTSATAQGAVGFLAGLAKMCAAIGGSYYTLIVLAAMALATLVSYIIYIVDEDNRNTVDWEANPIPEYIYDVQEVGFTETSKNEGIETDYIKRPEYVFYEVVRDTQNRAVDLNARAADSRQWIAMYVSYDRPGDGAKPIKANDFRVKTGNGETPLGYVPAARFGEVRAYNLNQWDKTDLVNGIYLFYQQDQEISMNSNQTYYIYEVHLQTGESTAHCISLLEAAGYTPINVNLSPDYKTSSLFSESPVFTYLGYKLTTNPNSAITDLRMEYGPAEGTVQVGAITYASCGSSAGVTLYATKYKAAGTPLLAAGLKCTNSRFDVPAGYEPVCFLSGGPAQSFNTTSTGIAPEMQDYFIYFLPETTFTDGEIYLGGLAYYYCDDSAFSYLTLENDKLDRSNAILEFLKERTGTDYPVSTQEEKRAAMDTYLRLKNGYHRMLAGYSHNDNNNDLFLLYNTHNPYRAIYQIKGSALEGIANQLTVESNGYVANGTIYWKVTSYGGYGYSSYDLELCLNGQGTKYPVELTGKLYFAGNPSKNNVYDTVNKKMSETEPIISDSHFLCVDKTDPYQYDTMMSKDSPYTPVSEMFSSSSTEPIVYKHKGKDMAGYVIFVRIEEVEKPYISAITAVDRLTIFRAAGGSDADIKRTDITENMLLTQLAKQGATYYADIQASTYRDSYLLNIWNFFGDEHTEMNLTKFGYTRTDDADTALRDLFIYVPGFTDDEPPREIYRGKVKYTLLCELSGNLTGYEEAPAPGAYLYGTTDKKAGERIIDIDFTDSPFKSGYETVRTKDGRSMWAELTDYMTRQADNHFMSGAKTLFEALKYFFCFQTEYDEEYYDDLRAQKYYYIHFKREGDDLRTQKPYISELYLSTGADSDKTGGENLIRKGILDDLFDQGAEDFLDFDLNTGVYTHQYVYLGYSYTADPNNAITSIRPSHNNQWGSSVTLRTNGVQYLLVSETSVNAGAGGDSIYLYYTKSHHEEAGKPITEIRYCQNAEPTYMTTETAEILPVMRFDKWKPSDLNAGINNRAIYLSVVRPFETPMGTYKTPKYGDEKTTTRKGVTGSEEGKYLAALYVMDKNTIRQEKLTAGVASDQCTCEKISDQEVIDRLKQMGATTVLATPICIKGGEYGKKNDNKVFIGYSRTDDEQKAIKNIAFKAEILSLKEPDSTIEIGKKSYTLVAEAAKKVTKLPRAINLIGTQDGQDLLLPRLYLYTSTVGETAPIYDICIDTDPLMAGWVTARSESGVEPFIDLYQQAKKQAELGAKDDSDSYDSELVYSDELYKWMNNLADTFNPGEESITPFYIHCKKMESDDPIEEILPYISELFVAAGDSKRDALSQLVAFEPDAYLDYDLNKGAGGDYIYIAYKRTDIRSDALTDIVITLNDKDERIWVYQSPDKGAPYDLVAHVDLNSDVTNSLFADRLYLYTSKSPDAGTGEPINDLYIYKHRYSTKDKNGFYTDYTALKVFWDSLKGYYYPVRELGVQNGDPDLNDGAGGKYIYLVMKRTPEAHDESIWPASMFAEGSVISIGILFGIGVLTALFAYAKRKKKR